MQKIELKQWLILILIVAFVFRFDMILDDRDFWHDEAFQLLYSQKDPSFIINSNDVHPPLFNLMTHSFYKIGIDTPFKARFVMVMISLLFIIGFFIMVREIFDGRTAFVATALISLAPTYIYYSTEYRNYMFVLLFTVIQISTFNLMFKKYQHKYLNIAIYIVSSLYMVYSHYLAGLIIFAQIIYLILVEDIKKYWKIYATMSVASLPLAIYALRMIPKMQTFWFKNIGLKSLFSTFIYLVTMPSENIYGLSLIIYGVIFYTMFRFRNKLDKRHLQFILYLIIPIVTMFAISQVYAFYHHRYFLFGGISLYILAGWGISQWYKVNKDIDLFWIVVFGAILLSFWVQMNGDFNHEIRDSVDFLHNITNNNTIPFVTVHTSTFSQSPYKAYFPTRKHYLVSSFNRSELFTAGGSIIGEDELHSNFSFVSAMSEPVYFISNKPIIGEIIYETGGLYVTEIKK